MVTGAGPLIRPPVMPFRCHRMTGVKKPRCFMVKLLAVPYAGRKAEYQLQICMWIIPPHHPSSEMPFCARGRAAIARASALS